MINSTINNEDSFTQLYSLLKRYDKHHAGSALLDYETDELKIINHHIDNAIQILLQGLQGIGQLIASANKSLSYEINQLGFFISAISNLNEALYDLRLDADYVLKQRETMNY